MKLTAHLRLVPRIIMSVTSMHPLCSDAMYRSSFTFYASVVKVKIKGKGYPITATKAQRWSRYIAVLIL